MINPAKLSNSQFSKGFTLAELITAIGVLTILTAAVLAAVNPLEQYRKGQDTRRKNDLAQLQKALEIYYQDNGEYPLSHQGSISLDGGPNGVIDWGDPWTPYIDVLPRDPVASQNYAYYVGNSGQSYALFASLERGDKDPQICGQIPCLNSAGLSCGSGVCNYGVSSPNISP